MIARLGGEIDVGDVVAGEALRLDRGAAVQAGLPDDLGSAFGGERRDRG